MNVKSLPKGNARFSPSRCYGRGGYLLQIVQIVVENTVNYGSDQRKEVASGELISLSSENH